MHLSTIEQVVTIIGGGIGIASFMWAWMVRPWLKGLAKEIVPDHDPDAPTMRQMQEEQTELARRTSEATRQTNEATARMEAKLDERLTAFGRELAAVKEAVKPIPQLVQDVQELKDWRKSLDVK